MFKYPYGDSQQLNLDWIIQKIKELEAGGGGSSDLTLEEVANALISLTYNSGTAYQRYDYCYLQGKLYRALANTSGTFDPASWMEVRIGDDIPVLTRLLNAVDTSLSTLQNTVDNLDSDDIENASSQVSGTTVTNALDNLKGAISAITYHNLTGIDLSRQSSNRLQLKGINGVEQYLVEFNPVTQTISQSYTLDGQTFTTQWSISNKVNTITQTDASQSSYVFEAGGELSVTQCGKIVQVSGGFGCVSAVTSSPGELIASGLPGPNSTVLCSLTARGNFAASKSVRALINTSGQLYFRYGEASVYYDIYLTYIAK